MLGEYALQCKLELWVAQAGRDWFKYYLKGIYPGLRLQRKTYMDPPVKGARSLLVFQQAAFPEEDPDSPENPAYAGCVWEFILRDGAPCGLNRAWILYEVSFWADVDDIARAAVRGQFLGHQIAADEGIIPCVVSSAWKEPEAVRVLAHQTRVLLLEATFKTEKDPELDVSVNTGIAEKPPVLRNWNISETGVGCLRKHWHSSAEAHPCDGSFHPAAVGGRAHNPGSVVV